MTFRPRLQASITRAQQLEPLSLIGNARRATVLAWIDQPEEADSVLLRALEVRLLGGNTDDYFQAYRRGRVPLTIHGQAVLQHTRTSAWDFTVAPRDPFAKP